MSGLGKAGRRRPRTRAAGAGEAAERSLCCAAVPAARSSHVEVYVFRRSARGARVLLLRRTTDRRTLPGAWQPVTGKRRARESAFAAARREVREETGLTPARWWMLETPALYVEPVSGALIVLPRYAAEITGAHEVRLSREHDACAWLALSQAARRVVWGSQARGIESLGREVVRTGPLARALELNVTPPRRRRRG